MFYRHKQLLARLMPPVAYNVNQPGIDVALTVDGIMLDAAYQYIFESLQALQPHKYTQWLKDYERVYALPNGIWPDSGTLEDRILAVTLALRESLGISRAFFMWLALLLGYEITIDEFMPFVAGSKAGDALTNGDWRYVWVVNSAGGGNQRFRAGRSVAGQPLSLWGNERLEKLFTTLKPAHTKVYFAYGEN